VRCPDIGNKGGMLKVFMSEFGFLPMSKVSLVALRLHNYYHHLLLLLLLLLPLMIHP
jgi:hypothetical protein